MRMPDDAGLPVTNPLPPHHEADSGWTPERRAKFLALLAENGNVRLSALSCGLSPQSAYKLRRRDATFARTWMAALSLARDHADQVLADRALLGVEEPVFYRGEQVGVRRRFDTRLLLAHLARLDTMVHDVEAIADAGRFDELVALIAGERFAGRTEGPCDEAELPPQRDAFADRAAQEAQDARDAVLPAPRGEHEWDAHDAEIMATGNAARLRATAAWDDWFARACTRVDAATRAPMPLHRVSDSPLLARPGLRAWTLSTVSTGAMAVGMMADAGLGDNRALTMPSPRPRQGPDSLAA